MRDLLDMLKIINIKSHRCKQKSVEICKKLSTGFPFLSVACTRRRRRRRRNWCIERERGRWGMGKENRERKEKTMK